MQKNIVSAPFETASTTRRGSAFLRMTAADYNKQLLAGAVIGSTDRHSSKKQSKGSGLKFPGGAQSAFGRMTAAEYNAQLLIQTSENGFGCAKGKPRVQLEEIIHRACFEWIFRHEHAYPALRWVFHTPSGGARSAGEAGKMKGMGARKGVVDVISPFPALGGPGLAIEIKAPKKKPTLEQQDFLDRAASCGWVHGVCFCLEDFQSLVRQYLGVGPNVRML